MTDLDRQVLEAKLMSRLSHLRAVSDLELSLVLPYMQMELLVAVQVIPADRLFNDAAIDTFHESPLDQIESKNVVTVILKRLQLVFALVLVDIETQANESVTETKVDIIGDVAGLNPWLAEREPGCEQIYKVIVVINEFWT